MRFFLLLLLSVGSGAGFTATPVVDATASPALVATPVVDHLRFPWSVAFLSADEWLITERGGRLWRVSRDGRRAAVTGLPENIFVSGQGGLFDVVLHPNFADNGWVYLAYAAQDARGRANTAVVRGRLVDDALREVTPIFQALPQVSGRRHFGGKLLFDERGDLFVSLGDRGDTPERAQDLADHSGSLIRLRADGHIPEDNPLRDSAGARPEIYTYGNRNIQGLARDPVTQVIWMHEHGPMGGDELNRVQAGANYGWPRVTHGIDYDGTVISPHRQLPGLADPSHVWIPSIAVSGLAVYRGELLPTWNGDLLVGALRGQTLVRLVVDDNQQIIKEERRFSGQLGRIREVRVGPNGRIYVLNDAPNGRLWEIAPRVGD